MIVFLNYSVILLLLVQEWLQELVEGVHVEFARNLDLFVRDGAQVPVAHADHDDRPREAVALQGNQVDFVLAQGAVGSLLSLDLHVVIQLVGKRLQIVPIGGAHLVGTTHCHQFVEAFGKGCLVALVGPLQQLVNDLYLVVNDGFKFL